MKRIALLTSFIWTLLFVFTGFVAEGQIVSAQDGDWSSGSTWNGGVVPAGSDDVIINHNVTLNGNVTRESGKTTTINNGASLTINSGASFITKATFTNNGTTIVYGTFQIDEGGWATGNHFQYQSGSYLVFDNNDNYEVNNSPAYWPASTNAPETVVVAKRDDPDQRVILKDEAKTIKNLILFGGLEIDNSSELTVTENLEIRAGGYIDKKSPNYGPSSTLKYITGGEYKVSYEWPTGAPTNDNNPVNVEILKDGTNVPNTTINYPGKATGTRKVRGNLSIGEDCSLYMDYGNISSVGPLIVSGDVTVSGNLSLGEEDGDDLKLGGNLKFEDGSNFYPKERAVFFTSASGIQEIITPSNADLTIPYVVAGGEGASFNPATVKMNQNLKVTAPKTGHAIAFSGANNFIDLNGYTLTIGTPDVASDIEGAGAFIGSISSTLEILGKGDLGVINFKSGGQILKNLIIDRSSAAPAATLGSALVISGTGSTFENGILNINNSDLTFDENASYTRNNGFINATSTGYVVKNFPSSAGSFTYPIGDGTNYTPATINLTSVTGTPSVSMNVVNAKHPQNNASTNYLIRYWRVTSTGTFTGDATFTYVPGDVFGTESSLITAGWNGAPNNYWNLYNNTNSGTHTLSATGLSDLNLDFTGGDKFASAAVYFKSKQTGDWNSLTSWLMSTDNITWVDAASIPDQNALGITIQNSHKITLTADASARKLRVDAGGILDLGGNTTNSSGNQLTIYDDGTTSSDFNIYGTLVLYGKNISYNNSSAKTTVYAGGLVRADNNYVPEKSDEFAKSSQVFFNNNSIFQWNTTNPFSFSGVTYFPNASVSTIPYFVISQSVTVGGGSSTTINGLTIINANTTFNGGGSKIFRNGISGSSTLTQGASSGSLNINGNNAILGGSNLNLSLSSPLNLAISVTVPKDSSVTISGANVNNNITGNILTINGKMDVTSQQITNKQGTVNISETGVFRSSNPGNTDWPLISIPSGTVNLNPNSVYGSTVEMYAMANQTFKARTDFSNLTFSGSGTKTPSSGFTNNGTITIKDDAIFDCTDHNIGGANSNLTMTDNSSLIVSTTGTQPFMEGTYALTGGVIKFTNNRSTRENIRSKTYNNIEVWGSNVGNSTSNITLRNNGSFVVKPTGIFIINDESIKAETGATVSVVVENGGKFICGNDEGFNGYVPSGFGDTKSSSIHGNISNISLANGSTVEYSRGGDQPITTGSFTYQNLTLSGTGSKIAPFKANLPINGNFTVSGGAEFIHNSSTVTFINTTDPQDILTVSATYPPVFYNLKNQNTQNLNINNFISVKNELILDDNSKINLKDIVRLVSDEDGTASVPPIPEGANAATIAYDVNGAFRVERFIPGHTKAWQTLSVPTKGSTIFNSWQNSRVYEQYKGTTITAPFNDWAARGFDIKSSSPSMKVYDPATDTYVGVPNTSMLIDNPNGYMFFVRGDRSVTETWEPATEVTLQTTGKLYAPTPPGEGPVTVSVPPNSFAMVGNPYASSIKYDQITLSSNLQWDYYIWDPQLTSKPDSKYGLGGFRAILKDDSKATPESGNYMNGSIPPIQSGQAFFVFNPSAKPGTVSFTESAKVSGSNLILRPGKETIKNPEVAINLFTGPAGEETLMDGAKLIFNDEYSPEVNQQDTKKIGSSNDAIYIVASPYPLSIERRPLPAEKDTIFFGLSSMKARGYSLEINTNVMSEAGYEIYFHDKLLKTVKQLDDGDNKIAFEVTKDPASKATGRFFLTLKPALPPFAFADERAKLSGDEVAVSWRGLQQTQVDRFIVEHSTDGAAFNNKGNVAVTKGESGDYIFTASEPQSGINYYRIKAVMKDGSLVYSKIVSVMVQFRASAISISPNPAKEVIRIQFYRMSKGDYSVRIYSADGKLVMNRKLSHPGGTADYRISPQAMAKGIYHVDIIKPDGSKTGEQLLLDK